MIPTLTGPNGRMHHTMHGYGYIDNILIAQDHTKNAWVVHVERVYEAIASQLCPGCPLEAVLEEKKKVKP